MNDFRIPKKVYYLIPPGSYTAEILSLEQADGRYGLQVKFTFSVNTTGLDYIDSETQITAWTSANYSENSKLFKWARAALGPEFDPKADFEASKIIGKKVLVSVVRATSGKGTEFNKITDVLPLPREPQQLPIPSQGPTVGPDWDKN